MNRKAEKHQQDVGVTRRKPPALPEHSLEDLLRRAEEGDILAARQAVPLIAEALRTCKERRARVPDYLLDFLSARFKEIHRGVAPDVAFGLKLYNRALKNDPLELVPAALSALQIEDNDHPKSSRHKAVVRVIDGMHESNRAWAASFPSREPVYNVPSVRSVKDYIREHEPELREELRKRQKRLKVKRA